MHTVSKVSLQYRVYSTGYLVKGLSVARSISMPGKKAFYVHIHM